MKRVLALLLAAVMLLALGACGVISVLSNVLPAETVKMCRLFFDGRISESAAMQCDLIPLISALFSDVNPIPVKEAMNYLGFEVGGYRLPLCAMGEGNRNRLIFALEQLDDISWKR